MNQRDTARSSAGGVPTKSSVPSARLRSKWDRAYRLCDKRYRTTSTYCSRQHPHTRHPTRGTAALHRGGTTTLIEPFFDSNNSTCSLRQTRTPRHWSRTRPIGRGSRSVRRRTHGEPSSEEAEEIEAVVRVVAVLVVVDVRVRHRRDSAAESARPRGPVHVGRTTPGVVTPEPVSDGGTAPSCRYVLAIGGADAGRPRAVSVADVRRESTDASEQARPIALVQLRCAETQEVAEGHGRGG